MQADVNQSADEFEERLREQRAEMEVRFVKEDKCPSFRAIEWHRHVLSALLHTITQCRPRLGPAAGQRGALAHIAAL